MKIKIIVVGILALGISAYVANNDYKLAATDKYYSEQTNLYLPEDLEATL
jgi:hypothetical protein